MTATRQQEHNESKATSPLFLRKLIAKLEMSQRTIYITNKDHIQDQTPTHKGGDSKQRIKLYHGTVINLFQILIVEDILCGSKLKWSSRYEDVFIKIDNTSNKSIVFKGNYIKVYLLLMVRKVRTF